MTKTQNSTARAGQRLAAGLLAGTMLAGAPVLAHAAEANESATVAEVIVTAQKREENLQKVSASVIALDSRTLSQRNVAGNVPFDVEIWLRGGVALLER